MLSSLLAAGAILGMKVRLGDAHNEVGIHGHHALLEGFVDALCLSAPRHLLKLFMPLKLLVVHACTLLSQCNDFSYCT